MDKFIEVVRPSSPDLTALPPRTGPSRKTNNLRTELTVFAGEFVGTFMFLFMAFAGTQIASESVSPSVLLFNNGSAAPEVTKLLYISLSFGAALAVNVAIFADISGGMFNPAVTTALCILGRIRWLRALHSIFAQLLASICSAFVISALLPGSLPVATTLDPSMNIARGFFLEMFLTAQLVLTIVTLPAGPSKPLYIGTALFVAEMAGVYYTGGSLNPARTLGPSCVVGAQGSDWIYYLGPMLGAGLGGGVSVLLETIKGKNV